MSDYIFKFFFVGSVGFDLLTIGHYLFLSRLDEKTTKKKTPRLFFWFEQKLMDPKSRPTTIPSSTTTTTTTTSTTTTPTTIRGQKLHRRGLFWVFVLSMASVLLDNNAFRGSLVRLSSLSSSSLSLTTRMNKSSTAPTDGPPPIPRTKGSWGFLEQSTLQEKRLVKQKGIPSGNATTTIRSTHHQVATTTTTTATLANPRYNRTLTLLIPLGGELCNHLMLLADAYIMKRYVERHITGLSIQLLGQHQANRKWVHGYRDLTACFPNFRDFEFSAGIHDTEHGFAAIQRQQKIWLGTNASLLWNIKSLAQIDYLKSLLNQQEQQQPAHGDRAPNQTVVQLGNNSRYSLPYLTSRTFMDHRSMLQDSALYHELRDWFQINTTLPQCCGWRAESDEVVFHFRNFITEIRRASIRDAHNFVELSPNETAQYLFGSNHRRYGNHTLKTKRKMALISRFPDTATPFVETLRADGWTVRQIEGQSGMEDFCFALSAQRELVGLQVSTYTQWAGFLGNATGVRLYRVARNPQDPDASGLWNQTRIDTLTALPGRRSFWLEEYARQENMTTESLQAQAVALVETKRTSQEFPRNSSDRVRL